MLIETQQLLIRDVKTEDEIPFIQMASDGSLNDIGFDIDCGGWMVNWIDKAKEFAIRDNPATDYLAYTITLNNKNIVVGSIGCSYYEDFKEIGITYFIGTEYRNNGYVTEAVKAYMKYFFNHYSMQKLIATVRSENVSSWQVIEKAGFILKEKRMYKDINDNKEKMYHFYEIINKK